jgi:predicted ATPase
MKFTLKSTHKSIRHLPATELPDFTVITGVNGGGKTHFLEAIAKNRIEVEGISKASIQYYDWTTLAPADEEASPRDAERKTNELWKQTLGYIEDSNRGFGTKLQQLGIPVIAAMNVAEVARLDEQAILDLVGNAEQAKACFVSIKEILQYASDKVRGHTEKNHYLRRVWTHIEENSGIPLIAISEDEFYAHCPLVAEETDPFQAKIAKLFASYVSASEANDIRSYRAEKRGKQLSYLSEAEFRNRHGAPPWETLNQSFEAAGLDVRIKEPSADASRDYVPRLYDKFEQTERKASDLSSGERILVSFATYLFFSRDGRQPATFPDLILLDEVDAPLHPSMARSLLRIIEQVIVGEFGRRVILATHSPSTVALASEDAIYVMDKSARKLRKASKDEAIRTLTTGVPVLSVNIENRRQVFVEGKNDVVFYETLQRLLQPKLEPEISLVFLQTGTKKEGGCDRVKEMVRGLHANGVRSVFGVIDWDRKNTESDHILVLGMNKRYSIESYILDPVPLAAFLLREKLVKKPHFGLTDDQPFTDLRDFGDDRLQTIVDRIIQLMEWPDSTDNREKCVYSGGQTVFIPRDLLQREGHQLESDLKAKFPELNKFRNQSDLTLEVVRKVLDDFPGFISTDIEELFKLIQTS